MEFEFEFVVPHSDVQAFGNTVVIGITARTGVDKVWIVSEAIGVFVRRYRHRPLGVPVAGGEGERVLIARRVRVRVNLEAHCRPCF